MSFFINDAWAQQAPQEPSLWLNLLPLVALFVVFYFILIRPQTQRAKKHRDMLGALSRGDEVMTTGGLAGRITEIGECMGFTERGGEVHFSVATLYGGRHQDRQGQIHYQAASDELLAQLPAKEWRGEP